MEINVLDAQSNFLKEQVFNDGWRVFDNMALIAHSNETDVKDFGTLSSLSDIHSFIDNSANQINSSGISLCSVFKQLTTMYLLDVNIILFVNEFHQFGDECSVWMKQIRENAGFVHFVSTSKRVDVQYILLHFPQATFTSWNNMPNNWDISSYGCQNFEVSKKYPCLSEFENVIIYDKSRYSTLFTYQRLTNFLLTSVFIKQWSARFIIYNYPDNHVYIDSDRSQMEMFIHQNFKSTKEPLICDTLVLIQSNGLLPNLIIFVYKFDKTVLLLEGICKQAVYGLNKNVKHLTFISLSTLVDKTFLKRTFPNSAIVEWNIETEEKPDKWNEMLWTAFGCQGLSPILFPHNVSTVAPTTNALTSTTKSSTLLSSTTHKQRSSKETTTTTEAQTASSKTTNKQKGNSKELLILTAVFVPLFIIFLIGVVILFCFYRHKQRQQLIDNMVFSNLNKLYSHFNKKSESDQWEIDIEYVQTNFIDKLGSGAFCDVFNGKLLIESPAKEIHNDSRYQRFYNCDVAVKTLPAMMQSDRLARNEFQKEIEFMKTLKFHQNVVCFLGFVNNCENSLMLLEYCANGDLLKFIRTNKQKFVENFESQDTTNCKSLLSFAWQISTGLEYLSSLNLIHRDVALRNVLLDNNNICKICDFGLSCLNSSTQISQSSGRKFPLKWMAIESIKENVFSVKTDVWSYGILLWELFTLGDSPYNDVKSVLSYLESGQRLNKPNYCTDEIYVLMASCWLVDPNERPNFTEICKLLATKIEAATKIKYNYVDAIDFIEEI